MPVLIVEGEFDALLAWQTVGHLVNVVTVGSAGQAPRPAALAELDRCDPWLIGLDNDPAGFKGRRLWMELRPEKARQVWWPKGCDFGDFVSGGGDPIAFVESQLEHAKNHWPLSA